jgi:hypothetical protein
VWGGFGEREACSEWQAFEGQTDGVECSDGPSSRGFDNGSNVGVEVSGPFGAEAIGDFPEDDDTGTAALVRSRC